MRSGSGFPDSSHLGGAARQMKIANFVHNKPSEIDTDKSNQNEPDRARFHSGDLQNSPLKHRGILAAVCRRGTGPYLRRQSFDSGRLFALSAFAAERRAAGPCCCGAGHAASDRYLLAARHAHSRKPAAHCCHSR